ncbi:CD1375 family protein [Paenibacillus sp. GYB004]|uniref:CD1375 family protein n=1 Tax=Paenibacillus sp. GYB004 TaxID=2994393 RepID=UPI002F964939
MMRRCIVWLLLYLLGEEVRTTMVTVYVTLIIKGYKTFAQVPVNLQPQVEAELAVLELGIDGKPLPTEPAA